MKHFDVIRIFLVLLIAISIESCSSKKEESSLDNVNSEESNALEQAKLEMEVGRGMAGRLLAFYGKYDDESLVSYVNQVGSYVSTYSKYPERRYMFEVLDSESINAFACPGGYIFVTIGAIKHAKNEAELASILAHEVAHVGEKHMFNTLNKMSEEDITKTNKEMDKKLNIPESVAVRKRPDGGKNAFMEFIGKYLGGSSAVLNVVQTAKAGMALILDKGLGAKLEYDADILGVTYATNAGYHPKALTGYLCRLENQKNKINSSRCRNLSKTIAKKSDSILEKTHPPIRDRVVKIKSTLKGMGLLKAYGAKGTSRFKKNVASVPMKAH